MVTVNNDLPVIHTARLKLRPVQKDDLEDFSEIFSDPATVQYFAMEPLDSPEKAEAFLNEKLEANQDETKYYLAICLSGSGKMIGQFTLFNIDKTNRRAEVGYIFNRGYWGQGFASEALAAVIDDCFTNQGFSRLEADVDPENAGSLKLLERHGFEREGYFRKRWYFREKWYDSVMFGLLKPGLE